MRVVIDHCMKPQIRHGAFDDWAAGMRALAEDTGAFCKLSGIVTESDGWSEEKLAPYVHHVIDMFGPGRVMWGSDWPVCRLEASYEDWRRAAERLTQQLSDGDRAAIFGETARAFYRI